ncbi:MAG TPA: hypothetical protein VG225_11230 [Terracidiphilus sp.]|jgi:hypothetical protein|nr:hypothetical protein [Terracidiphilus sp.]
MTIAIGMLCDEGLIIAADTQLAMTDNTTRQGIKVSQAIADTGMYIAAIAADDGNAATTLIGDVRTDLQNEDPKSFAALELIVRDSMSEWSSRFSGGNPWAQIVLGAFINQPEKEDVRTGGGIRLYLCEPPNTMLAIDREDSSGGYIGIGAAATIPDVVFRMLFGANSSPKEALHHVAYLMHRAKTGAATLCGGQTDAVLLKNDFSFPQWVRRSDMEIAEKYGGVVDFTLRMAACNLLAQTDEAAAHIYESMRPYFVTQSKIFREHKFLTETGEEVA